MEELLPMQDIRNGVFIMYHRNQDGMPLIVEPNSWLSFQNKGEIADGVLLVEAGKMLVVAPTTSSSKLRWASADISGGGITTSDRLAALNDWKGKENTSLQITHSECQSIDFAPGFCSLYSRKNANGVGLLKGSWWLPSMGELMMIYSNMSKINYALGKINGSTLLTGNLYWSSTEYSSENAWGLSFTDGYTDSRYRKSSEILGTVRPVSAFYR